MENRKNVYHHIVLTRTYLHPDDAKEREWVIYRGNVGCNENHLIDLSVDQWGSCTLKELRPIPAKQAYQEGWINTNVLYNLIHGIVHETY